MKKFMSICVSIFLTSNSIFGQQLPGTFPANSEKTDTALKAGSQDFWPTSQHHSIQMLSIQMLFRLRAGSILNLLNQGGIRLTQTLGKQPWVVCSQNCSLPDLEEVSRRVPAALRASQPPVISLQSLVTCTHGILVRSCILYTPIVQVCHRPPSVGSREAVTTAGCRRGHSPGTCICRLSARCSGLLTPGRNIQLLP